jgi:hypothetical protein
MPEISRFLGIVIAMVYNDHPPPHFHVRYGGQRAIIDRHPRRAGRCAVAACAWLGGGVGFAAPERASRQLRPCAPPCTPEPGPTVGAESC